MEAQKGAFKVLGRVGVFGVQGSRAAGRVGVYCGEHASVDRVCIGGPEPTTDRPLLLEAIWGAHCYLL